MCNCINHWSTQLCSGWFQGGQKSNGLRKFLVTTEQFMFTSVNLFYLFFYSYAHRNAHHNDRNFGYVPDVRFAINIAVMVCLSFLIFIVIFVVKLDVLNKAGLCTHVATPTMTMFRPATLTCSCTIINLDTHCTVWSKYTLDDLGNFSSPNSTFTVVIMVRTAATDVWNQGQANPVSIS